MNTKRITFWSIFVIVLALIIWGLVVAQKKSSSSGTSNLGTPAPVTATDHVEGTSTAAVTLIEYGDFQCLACSAYAPIVEQLFASSSDLRVVFRNFPLPQHPNAEIAAQAAEAASNQGQFWGMYKLLYAGQADWENDSDADARTVFDGYAATLGVDKAQFDADIDSTAVKAKIASDQTEGQSLGINYTPTFFVNGNAITNPEGYAPFKAIIDAAAQ
jgi:protein-disulfide isomerase